MAHQTTGSGDLARLYAALAHRLERIVGRRGSNAGRRRRRVPIRVDPARCAPRPRAAGGGAHMADHDRGTRGLPPDPRGRPRALTRGAGRGVRRGGADRGSRAGPTSGSRPRSGCCRSPHCPHASSGCCGFTPWGSPTPRWRPTRARRGVRSSASCCVPGPRSGSRRLSSIGAVAKWPSRSASPIAGSASRSAGWWPRCRTASSSSSDPIATIRSHAGSRARRGSR